MEELNYTMRVSPFKQKIILIQIGLAIGLPFGILSIFLLYIKAWYGLGLLMILLIISTLFVLTIYGKYGTHYLINKDGILCEPDAEQSKTNQTMNALTIFAGFFAKLPSVSGAGLLANSNQTQFFAWGSIQRITWKKDYFEIKHNNKQVLLLNYPSHLEKALINALKTWGKDIENV